MATISANALAVYQLSSSMTSPMDVIESDNDTVAGADAAGYSDGDYAIVVDSDGDFIGIGEVQSSAWVDQTSTLSIMTAATSTNLEAQNTVNETVAHNGTGGSTTYIISGAMSWSMSVDGLLDLSATGVGSSTSVMDAARSKEYLIVRFDTGTNTQYIGQALIDSVTLSGGVDDIATYSASFSGNGDLYKYSVS